jgi:exopolyphosphatase/guanosine-5'-triphosphate,3'-diphosphate pyrophosphatase
VADTRALNGIRVSRVALDRVWEDFVVLSAAERARLPAVERGREDVILAGVNLLRVFGTLVGAPGFTASDGGLLEGVLLEAVAAERGEAAWVR